MHLERTNLLGCECGNARGCNGCVDGLGRLPNYRGTVPTDIKSNRPQIGPVASGSSMDDIDRFNGFKFNFGSGADSNNALTTINNDMREVASENQSGIALLADHNRPATKCIKREPVSHFKEHLDTWKHARSHSTMA